MMKKILLISAFFVGVFLFSQLSFALTEITTIESTGSVGAWSSVKLDNNGYAHAVERDNSNNYWRYCNNTLGSWTCKNILAKSGSYWWGSDLAFDSQEHIFIVVHHGTGAGIALCNDTATPYNFLCYDIGGDTGASFPTIDIDTNDKIHVAFVAGNSTPTYGNNTLGYFTWNSFDADNIYLISLKVDSLGNVHMGYNGASVFKTYILKNSTGYYKEVLDSETSNAYSTSLDLNGTVPHVAFAGEYSNLTMCGRETGSWMCESADSSRAVGWTSIMIDNKGKRHVFYEDKTLYKVVIANDTSGSWTTAVVDTFVSRSGDGNLGTPFAIASKKGRIADSTSYSTNITTVYYDSYNQDFKSAVFVDYLLAPSYITATFNYNIVNYGQLNHNSHDNPAPNQAGGIYNVTVDTNANYKVSASGTNFTNTTTLKSFSITNLKMDTDTVKANLANTTATVLSHSLQQIDTYTPSDTVIYNGYWLSIPAAQYAAHYNSTISVDFTPV